MVTSEYEQIPHVMVEMVRESPRSVLDVGFGWGKYGVLAREYTQAERVDGIDVEPPRYPVYDHVYLGDLRNLPALLPADVPRYDLAIFLEVIEHLEKPAGITLVDQLCERAKRVIITTPWGFRP